MGNNSGNPGIVGLNNEDSLAKLERNMSSSNLRKPQQTINPE